MANDNIQRILKATNFAAKKHVNQMRKDGKTPYINHPIGVASILSEECNIFDVDVLSAALLHDTIEDTDCTFDELKEHFGTDISGLVMEVSDDKNLSKAERKQARIDSAPQLSEKARLILYADKIYNLRDLLRVTPQDWDEDRVVEYFKWCRKVCENVKGTNPTLESIMSETLAKKL